MVQQSRSQLPILCLLFLINSLWYIADANAQAGDASSYRLIGTIEGKAFSGIVLDDAAGGQLFYRLHERLPDGSVVVKVASDTATLRRSDGSSFDLFILPGAKSAAQQNKLPVSVSSAPPASAPFKQPVREREAPAALSRGIPAGAPPDGAIQNPAASQVKPRQRGRTRHQSSDD